MKKLLGVFCLVLLFASCEKKNAQNSAAETAIGTNPAEKIEEKTVVYRYVNTVDGLNVRDKVGGSKIAFLEYDTCVEVLEKSEAAEIDGWTNNWYKIRMKNGTEGYAYGAYLSESLQEAARFRCQETGNKVSEWFKSWESKLASQIDIDTNPYNIILDESGNAIEDLRDFDGISFIFEATYDKEKDSRGSFLLGAICHSVFNGEEFLVGSDYPDFLPFRPGDSISRAKSILGKSDKQVQEENSVEEIWDSTSLIKIYWNPEENDSIRLIKFEKTGW